MLEKKRLGDFGEEVAAIYLRNLGFTLIERQYKTKRWGEIDLVAREGEVLVFVEVKTRTTKKYGEPYEAITFYKKRALKRAAEFYILARGQSGESLRMDLITILLEPRTKEIIALKHYRNAF